MKRWWIEDKSLLPVCAEPVIYGMSGEPLVQVVKHADVVAYIADVKRTLELLRDYTYLDAEPPELRAQNERCQRDAQRLLAELEGRGCDERR